MATKNTAAAGAQAERDDVRKRLVRMIAKYRKEKRVPEQLALEVELTWLTGRVGRFQSKSGGLGRK